ncbi:MAG TPA: hypothetical protein VIS96_01325, partial [Terrimicrobiaceae bacterium]
FFLKVQLTAVPAEKLLPFVEPALPRSYSHSTGTSAAADQAFLEAQFFAVFVRLEMTHLKALRRLNSAAFNTGEGQITT